MACYVIDDEIKIYLKNILSKEIINKIRDIEDLTNMPKEISFELNCELQNTNPTKLLNLGKDYYIWIDKDNEDNNISFSAMKVYKIIQSLNV